MFSVLSVVKICLIGFKMTPGKKLRQALLEESPLQVIGTMNAFVAKMAAEEGYRAIYLSGAAVANFSYGLPDLGMTTLNDVVEETFRITSAVDLPLLVDIDSGWGNTLMIEKAIRFLIKAGAAGIHIEDQIIQKRCGHRPNKVIVSIEEMRDRIKAAVEAKTDPDFVIMARCDALAKEGMEGLLKRALTYQETGADMFFPEAIESLEQYRTLKKELKIPILANMTEYGKTPLLTLQELQSVGIDIVLYPLSISRIMNLSAKKALHEIRKKGTQSHLIGEMQTREELYQYLNYYDYEKKLDDKGTPCN